VIQEVKGKRVTNLLKTIGDTAVVDLYVYVTTITNIVTCIWLMVLQLRMARAFPKNGFGILSFSSAMGLVIEAFTLLSWFFPMSETKRNSILILQALILIIMATMGLRGCTRMFRSYRDLAKAADIKSAL
jgi:hypothetical protein